MRAHRNSIATKLLLIMLGSGLLLTIISTVFHLYRNYTREMSLLDQRVHEVARSYVPGMTNSVWLIDLEQLRAQVVGLQQLPEICYVEVVVDGQKIVAVGNPAVKGTIRYTFPLVYPYKGKGITLGALTLYADAGAVRQRLVDEFLVILLNQMVTIALISTVLFFFFYGLVGRHLRSMADYLRTVDPQKLNTPLTLVRKPSRFSQLDEIDQLAYSLNEMRRNLKRSFDSLHQVNVELLRENRERIKAEKALLESEQRYSLLANSIQEVFWMVTPDYRTVLLISPAYEKIWGRTCDSLIARPHEWLEAVVEEDRKALMEVIAAIGKNPVFSDQIEFPEYRIRRPDGYLCWIKAKAVPLLDEQEKIWAIAGVCEDISNRKETEDKLRQAQKMEAIGTLAGGIAHDFNNILAAILGYADLLRYDMESTDPRRSNVEQIIRAGNRAKDLIKQILAFSRKSAAERRPILVPPIAKEALKLLRASIPSTIEIRQQIETEDAAVLADPVQIHQVIVNLCTNAAQAMEERGGVLSVSLEAVKLTSMETEVLHAAGGEYLLLKIADTGCGMDSATRQRIFDPYFTTKDFGKGSGMGLAVVHGIIQSCGGMVRVESAVNEGTTFYVYFPVTEVAAEEVAEQTAAWPTGSERILLVDDEPSIVDIGERWLTRLGYQVTAMGSSVEALDAFRRDPQAFDLLISDQTMPVLPGSELAKEILKLRPDFPIILCTGFSSMVSESVAEEIGIRKYLMKPLRGSELAQTVRQVLDEQQAGERPA